MPSTTFQVVAFYKVHHKLAILQHQQLLPWHTHLLLHKRIVSMGLHVYRPTRKLPLPAIAFLNFDKSLPVIST